VTAGLLAVGLVVVGDAGMLGVPEAGVGVVTEAELPGSACATTAERTPAAVTEPATSQRVIRETRRSPESRSAAPTLIADLSGCTDRLVMTPPGFQTRSVGGQQAGTQQVRRSR
jgi:hypothetical protein